MLRHIQAGVHRAWGFLVGEVRRDCLAKRIASNQLWVDELEDVLIDLVEEIVKNLVQITLRASALGELLATFISSLAYSVILSKWMCWCFVVSYRC